jgi:PAS domain S-box-containing protein
MFVLENRLFADLILNRAADAAFCINESGSFLYVNDAMCHLSGYSRDQLMKMSLFDIDAEIVHNWENIWQELQLKRVNLASQLTTQIGQLIPIEISIVYAEENGLSIGCGYVHHPSYLDQVNTNSYFPTEFSSTEFSSAYKKKEAELESSLALLRSTFESSANGILAVNFEGEVLCYNQKFMDMWRLPSNVRLTKSCERAKAFFESQVKDIEVFRSSVWEMPAQLEIERYDLIELKDGRIFAHYSEPHRLDNKIIGRVWSIWDITESQKTEQALRLNEARFRVLAETNQASIFLIKDSNLCYVNPAAETLTGGSYKPASSKQTLTTG